MKKTGICPAGICNGGFGCQHLPETKTTSPKPKSDWEKELTKCAKELADNLEQFCGERRCLICGCEPELQVKMINEKLKQARQEGFDEGYKKGVKDEVECIETSGEHSEAVDKIRSQARQEGKEEAIREKPWKKWYYKLIGEIPDMDMEIPQSGRFGIYIKHGSNAPGPNLMDVKTNADEVYEKQTKK